ncbi:glycosyltransferase [Hoyosella subflava]|nr:glycosyltransferase [Hoyosella subflava]
MARIGICMIVKNEAHVIRRCLTSVEPLADYILIVDTGSTDGTQDIVLEYLTESGRQGKVIEEPWRDFAYNRSYAMQKLREVRTVDYGLMIDADAVLVPDATFDAAGFRDSLEYDLYDIPMITGKVSYRLPLLFSNRPAFHYRGVLHEFLDTSLAESRGTVSGFVIKQFQDSARNRNPRKYLDDADVLADALKTETDPLMRARYTFYRAQSLKDGGAQRDALAAYLERAQQGYWEQEVFVSLYRAAQLKEALEFDGADVVQSYLAAFEICQRVEALHGAIRMCRLLGKNHEGYILAKYAVDTSWSRTGLFVEEWIHDYGLLDEYALVAYWSGHYRESHDAWRQLLSTDSLPADARNRIERNAEFAVAKLADAGAS